MASLRRSNVYSSSSSSSEPKPRFKVKEPFPRHSDTTSFLRKMSRNIDDRLALGRSEILSCISDLKKGENTGPKTRMNVRHYPKVSCYDTCYKMNNPFCLNEDCSRKRGRNIYKVIEGEKASNRTVLNDIKNRSSHKSNTRKISTLHTKKTPKASFLPERRPLYRKTKKCFTIESLDENTVPKTVMNDGSIYEREFDDDVVQPEKRQKLSPSEDSSENEIKLPESFIQRLQGPGNSRFEWQQSNGTSALDQKSKTENKDDIWSSRGSPLLGYDWIAGALDNTSKASLFNLPDKYFEDLKSFRDAHWNECTVPAAQLAKTVKQQIEEQKGNLDDESHCVHKYRVNSRLQKGLIDETSCNICQSLRIKTQELPKYANILISKEKAVKKVSPVFEIPIKDSLALVQNCTKKKGRRK